MFEIQSNNKPSLLLIDDDVMIRESLSIALEDDFNVDKASGCHEGLSMIGNNRPSLVLLDLDMPHVNGVKTLEKIRDVEPDLAVLILTGNRSYENARRCADLNVHGFLEKPVDVEYLVKSINRVLKRDKLCQ